jgi:MFS family permease
VAPLAAVAVGVAAPSFPDPGGAGGGKFAPGSVGEAPAAGGRDLYQNVPLLLLAAVAGLGFVSEGVMETWSDIYLHDTLGLGAPLGAPLGRSGAAVFFAAMALGGFRTGLAVTRLGNRRVLQGADVLAAGGMALALVTTLPALVIGGFLLVGLTVSGMAPLTPSSAGGMFPKRAGAVVSVVITFGSGGGLLATPLVGGLAELTGLSFALGLVVLAGLAFFILSTRLRETTKGVRSA